jgi:hypothetical protein
VGLGFLCHIFKPTKVRTTIFYLLPALGALLLSACQDSLELGVNLVDEDRTQVQVVDTLRVESSSLLIDSMYTGNGPRMLVGEYEDPYFGKVSSQTYFDVDTLGNFKTTMITFVTIRWSFICGKITNIPKTCERPAFRSTPWRKV